MWAGAVPDREPPPPHSPCGSCCCLDPDEVFLLSAPSSQGFSQGFLRFCGFFVCSASLFLALGLFCEWKAPFLWVQNSLLAFRVAEPCLLCRTTRVTHSAVNLFFPWSPEPPLLLPELWHLQGISIRIPWGLLSSPGGLCPDVTSVTSCDLNTSQPQVLLLQQHLGHAFAFPTRKKTLGFFFSTLIYLSTIFSSLQR